MLVEELGLRLENPSPTRSAVTTFCAFLMAGIIPLLPYLISIGSAAPRQFLASTLLTGFIFIAIGLLRGHIAHRNLITAVAETLFIGGTAAGLAYLTGEWLKEILSG